MKMISILFSIAALICPLIFSMQSVDKPTAQKKITFQLTENYDATFDALFQLNNSVIGQATISINPATKILYINTMFIRAEYQKQGLGADFLSCILETVKELGFVGVELKPQPFSAGNETTLIDLKKLIEFYQRAGFCSQGTDAQLTCDLKKASIPTHSYTHRSKTTLLKKILVTKTYYKD